MGRGPMASDLDPAADPYAGEAPDVVEQPLQTACARRMADDAHVQADRHHSRLRGALAIQEVERVAAISEEVVSGREGAAPELRIVGRKAIGDDQVRAAADLCPVRKLIIVSI